MGGPPSITDPGHDSQADTWFGEEPGRVAMEETPLPPRYELLGTLGAGGVGRVLHVRDAALDRPVALKIIVGPPTQTRREQFLAEARAAARLEHPGIVPIYDVGTLRNGQPYYTMRVIEGRTLGHAVREAHASGPPDATVLGRMLSWFAAVCEAMAYAHSHGVVHRDLKPDNVMIGAFGEVTVVDWGLAGRVARSDEPAAATQVLTGVAGTPSYMAPEQARGEAGIGVPADVHALGATLYHLLTGRPPFLGASPLETLDRVVHEPPPPLPAHVPDVLAELTMTCLAKAPWERPAHAGEVAAAMRAWLDGTRKREQALVWVQRTDAAAAEVERMRLEAAALGGRSATLLAQVPTWAPIEQKSAGWDLEDRATALRAEADLVEERRLQALAEALKLADLPEVHDRLADHFRRAHAAAEEAGERHLASRLEILVRAHDTGAHTRYLQGTGALTLLTEPAGATVSLSRYELRHRRLEPVPFRQLTATPLRDEELPMGSYLVRIRAPGRVEVRYPAFVPRGGAWDGVPPGETEPFPIPLPSEQGWDPDDLYVPAGWFTAGGDPAADWPRPATRVWVDGLVCRRYPVTNADYLRFLDGLDHEGRSEEAELRAPLLPDDGSRPYGRAPGGGWRLQADHSGDAWLPDDPVVGIRHTDATAYVEWRRVVDGHPWRLPAELEREKVARGVDRRNFPWGDFLDPTWCCIRDSHSGRARPAPVTRHADDCSPYGVLGLAGNVVEVCADGFSHQGPQVVDGRPRPAEGGSAVAGRGASWTSGARWARVASRLRLPIDGRFANVGLRLVRSYP